MSLLFWRKRDSYGNESSAAASRADPMPVYPMRPEDTDEPSPVKLEQDYLPPVAGQTVTRIVEVPGIGTGAAYSDGDAFGTLITFRDVFRPEKRSGTVVNVVFHDLDDEGLQKDLVLFTRAVTATTDNDAFALSDIDNLACCGVVSVTEFYNWANNQIGQKDVGKWVNSTDTNLYALCVTRGADNIAAGSLPRIDITVVPN